MSLPVTSPPPTLIVREWALVCPVLKFIPITFEILASETEELVTVVLDC